MNQRIFYGTFASIAAVLLFFTKRTITMPTIVLVVAIAASIAGGAADLDVYHEAYPFLLKHCADSVDADGTVVQYGICLIQKVWMRCVGIFV